MCITLICLLLSIYICNADGKFRYDYQYDKDAGGWLKFHRMPANFFDAFLRCDFEGAVLASPLDGNLHKSLIKIQKKSKSNCGIYTGIHSTISNGDYTTIEGVPYERLSLSWSKHEPDNFENQENCIIMMADGTVADVKCNDTFSYVCYKKKTKNLLITECATVDDAYKLDKRTGSCYKFHRHGMSWRRAQMVCLAEGAYLAIIDSSNEAMVIRDLFSNNPANTINSPYKDVASIGFLEWNNTGLWYTVQGKKLQDAGYENWSSGQPDNTNAYGQGQSCGGVYRTGLLDDVWCDTAHLAFICEKSPESLASDDE